MYMCIYISTYTHTYTHTHVCLNSYRSTNISALNSGRIGLVITAVSVPSQFDASSTVMG